MCLRFDRWLVCLPPPPPPPPPQTTVRVVFGANFPVDQLANVTARADWVDGWVSYVQSTGADGVNVDFESVLNATDPRRVDLVLLLQQLQSSLKAANSAYQLTFDVAWSYVRRGLCQGGTCAHSHLACQTGLC